MTQLHDDAVSRRTLLSIGLAAAAGLLLDRRLLAQTDSARRPIGPGDLVIRNPRPLDAESPLVALTGYQTAPEHFFVRSHFGPPAQLPARWSLRIAGEVAQPVTLSLDEIRAMGGRARVVTLECAGNGRGLFGLPNTSGIQWERGAVSTAAWTGVPLGTILDRARPTERARHFWMNALDQGPLTTVPRFLRSVPRATALDDAFVAYEMNGQPIPLLHGGPLRLMAKGYRYADQSPVTTMRVKSLISSPVERERVRGARIVARGQAWSGAGTGGIRTVEVSSDGGASWRAARLVGPDARGAWRSWEADVAIASRGPQRLMARATDRQGTVQPMVVAPNPGGYGNNSIHEVRFDAVSG